MFPDPNTVEGRKHLSIGLLLKQYYKLKKKINERYPSKVETNWIKQKSNASFANYLFQHLQETPDDRGLQNWYNLIRKQPDIDYRVQSNSLLLRKMILQEFMFK